MVAISVRIPQEMRYDLIGAETGLEIEVLDRYRLCLAQQGDCIELI
jgi:hypothetical protein